MRSGRTTRTLRKRRNRRIGPPVWRRLPPARTVARALGRGARASVPALIALTVAGAIGAGSLYGYRWLTGSDKFAVAAIELSGNQRLSESYLLDRLAIERGDNIFRLGLPTLEHRLESDPWIADAAVSRRLPDTLIVRITEEEPAALVELGGLYLADATGRVFKRADTSRGEGVGLPIVTGISRDTYTRSPELARAMVVEALDALAIYDRVDSRPKVAEVHLDARRGIVFHTYEDAVAIRVGDGDSEALAARLRTFDAAWSALDPDERAAARVVYVDNKSRPDRVTVGFEPARRSDG